MTLNPRFRVENGQFKVTLIQYCIYGVMAILLFTITASKLPLEMNN